MLNSKVAEFPRRTEAIRFDDASPLLTDKDIVQTYSEEFLQSVEMYNKCITLRNKFKWGGRRISKKLNYSERQINNWTYLNIIPRSLKLVKSLEQRGLLPLSYNSPYIQIIARIVGHIYGDGWLSRYGKSKYVIGFSGQVEDLKEIQADLDILNVKYSSIYSRKTNSVVGGKEIHGTTNSFACSDHHLTRLIAALGTPYGKFSTQEISAPEWIMAAPLEVKREFLAALFGSDAYSPSHVKDSRSLRAVRLSFNRIIDLKDSALNFAKQIKSMLSDLDVKTSQIKILPGNTCKNGTKTMKILLTISNSTENLISFFSNVSYRYCLRKELKANIALNYLLDKTKVKNNLRELYEHALAMKKEGYDNKIIAERLGLSIETTERWIYGKYRGGNMSPYSFNTFDDWTKENCTAPILWSKVSSLSTVKNELVYDLTVEDTHNFIANGFIVHNCHRATGDYAYVWIAEQYKKVLNGRILALTASPASEKSVLDELRRFLNIEKVEVRSTEDADVVDYVQKKDIQKIYIDLPEELIEIIKALENVLKKRLLSLKDKEVIDTADPDKIRKIKLLELQRTLINQADTDQNNYLYVSLIAECLKIQHALLLLQTQGVSPLIEFFKKMEKQAKTVKAAQRLINDWSFKRAMILAYDFWGTQGEHPKFKVLRELVEKHKSEKMIIFTQYRSTVEKIVEMLSDLEGIRPARFIGQAKGMSQKEQVARLEAFQADKYNVLIATCIAEEGLSIKEVPVAIFFDSVPSALRLIQRTGRVGRTEAGKIYMLIAKGTLDEKYYWMAQRGEQRMYEILENMKTETGKQASLSDFK